jgi:hypothetical protein
MNGNSGVAEHATSFKGVIATFTKIDKAKGSAGTGTAGTKTRRQETPLYAVSYAGSSAVGCRPFVVLFYRWACDFVSTVFQVKGNHAKMDMTKRGMLNCRNIALIFQISDTTRMARHV